MKLKAGFTINELLIAVTIIAILAIIAVPNLLEAQLRTKVARTRSDMRMTAAAIGTYFTDYHAHPDLSVEQLSQHFSKVGLLLNEYSKLALNRLTTPVAYIASNAMLDFFAVRTQPSIVPGLAADRPPFVFGYLSTDAVLQPLPVITEATGLTYLEDALVPKDWIDREREHFRAHHFVLQSVGPDQVNFCRKAEIGPDGQNFPNAFRALTDREKLHYIYDPTNGSVSAGDLAWSVNGPLK